ncbi:MAG TPA: alpha/beta hydrolase [Mucilaginibacter sp.]|jgi:pimeloyl-ACP methyl ester carboxylesterase|nr:alpha/beta hydrolase [Mucilaginibacter sp.]
MKRPTIEEPAKLIRIKDLELGYLELNPNKEKTVFFVHGNSSSANTWQNQLADPLFAEHRLIAFDLPAHGISSFSSDPESDFSLPGLGAVIAEAVCRLSKTKSRVLIGISLGTNIVAETLSHLNDIDGVVLISPSVIGRYHLPETIFKAGIDLSAFFMDNCAPDLVVTTLKAAFFEHSSDYVDIAIEDYYKVSLGFRPTFIKTVGEGRLSDEIGCLSSAGIQTLVIFGENDSFYNTDYLNDLPFPVWQNSIFKIEGAAHYPHIDQFAKVNKLLADYIEAYCFK